MVMNSAMDMVNFACVYYQYFQAPLWKPISSTSKHSIIIVNCNTIVFLQV